MSKPVMLVTGASSGIGKAIVLALTDDGASVYGTTRNPSSFHPDDPRFGLVKMIQLDVCCDDSVERAVAEVMRAEGRIDILINNAGNGICGSVEDTSVEEARHQFETNFFGVLRMCRAVLPIMRAQGDGLIINIGSVAGHIAIPYQSMYSASKYALQALTEAMRIEARQFGVRAVVVDPGDTKTGFSNNRTWVKASSGSAYEAKALKAINAMAKSEQNAPDPATLVKDVKRIIKSKNPPVRVVVGWDYKAIVILKRLLPARLLEFVVSKLY